MSFAWVHFFDLARSLAAEPNEASQRSAISRAYYAAFHTARRYVRAKLPEVRLNKAGEDHFHVWDSLKKSARREERAAGIKGKALYDARKRADYDLVGLSFPRATSEALENAGSVLRCLVIPDDAA